MELRHGMIPPSSTRPADSLSAGVRDRDASTFRIEALRNLAVLGDLLFFAAGLMAAFDLRFDLPPLDLLRSTRETVTFWNYGNHFVFGSAFFCILAARAGLYQSNNLLDTRRLVLSLMNTSGYWTLGYISLSLLFYFNPPISRVFVLLGGVSGPLFVLAWRQLFKTLLVAKGIHEQIRQHILVVGWNVEADRLARAVFQDSRHLYRIAGCLPSAHNEYKLAPPPEVPQLGDYQAVREILQTAKIDIVLIADLDPKTREIIALCEFCNRELIPFKIIPTYFQILVSGLHLETISGVPVLGVARLPLDSLVNRIVKRILDIAGSIVGLILAVPIFLIFAPIVYLQSPGPVIYRQAREGRNGRSFTIYKIRSMKLDAEANGPQWSPNDDPRCLRIGAFMRRHNLDEVPQFWNVLRGEMSLVGPRPERPELIENFKDEIRHYNVRHYVKPGLTGWAQVNGLRGDTDLNERIRYDLFYLENWSPMFDFYIMLRTFRPPRAPFDRGAKG
jgi:exopolysaccharide biosynthesis polyprenyl glycosylphosphotransferase